MGYTLKIGQLKTEVIEDGLESYIYLNVERQDKRTESFLNVGEPTDGSNERWPSYGSWSWFASKADLEHFFFDDSEGLIREHPATIPLVEKHRDIVNEKYFKFMQENPDAEATYKDEDNEANSVLVRLIWLKYWINWALDNCETPVFYNS